MGRKLDLSKLTEEEAQHVWAVVRRDFDLRKKEEERLEVMKIGSLEWYYDHVRSRFKRFGSAKVMRSLYGRQQNGQNMDISLQERVYSLPDISGTCQHQAIAGAYNKDKSCEEDLDNAEAQRYSLMRKTKRLLSVHPFDFELDSEYSDQSRRPSTQLSSAHHIFQSFSEHVGPANDASHKESMIAEADLAAMFHDILQEQGQTMPPPGQEFSTEVLIPDNSNWKNLDKNDHRAAKDSSWNERQRSQYSADMDTSDEEMEGNNRVMSHQPHHTRRRSRASSQENVPHSGKQISDLNKRMYAIERMLNRLEEQIYMYSYESPVFGAHTSADLEEETLKKKLGELASNISEKGASSDEGEKTGAASKAVLSSSSDGPPNEAEKVYMVAGKAYGLEKKLQELEEQVQQSGTTDSELSGLEDKVATAAAQVQHAESEISYIESRIAALSAAGLTVTTTEKAKKKSSPKTPPSISRYMESFQEDQFPEVRNTTSSSNDDNKVLSMQQALIRKFNNSLDIPDGQDSFERNALYRGSLTQRNPNGKNRKANRIFAKPVLTHQ